MTTEGSVGFERLKLSCIIGTEPHERAREQEIWIDLKVKTDLQKTALSDHLEDAIDYVELAQLCHTVAQKRHLLLETFAWQVLEQILTNYKPEWAWICVRKPSALPDAACACVELKRGK